MWHYLKSRIVSNCHIVGSCEPQPSILTTPTQASPLMEALIYTTHFIYWLLKTIFQILPAWLFLSKKNIWVWPNSNLEQQFIFRSWERHAKHLYKIEQNLVGQRHLYNPSQGDSLQTKSLRIMVGINPKSSQRSCWKEYLESGRKKPGQTALLLTNLGET